MILALIILAAFPIPAITPGAIRTTDKAAICSTRTNTLRHVKSSDHRKVFALYGINCGVTCGKRYEVDHHISLEIGGTNEIENLWPQPYEPRPGAHEKDVLENKLHAMICHGDISPREAQKEIASDWWKAYQRYVKKADVKLGR
jgi:hypothetical protein